MFIKIFKTLFLLIAISLFASAPIWADSNNEIVEIPIWKQDKSHIERNLSSIPIQCLYIMCLFGIFPMSFSSDSTAILLK